MKSLVRFADIVERFSDSVGRLVSWLTLVMVLVTFVIVVLQKVFNLNWIWLQESVTWMHAVVFMIGAAYTLNRDGHVRVDIFYRDMSPAKQAWVNIGGVILFLMPVCGFIFWSSWDYVSVSWPIVIMWGLSWYPMPLSLIALLVLQAGPGCGLRQLFGASGSIERIRRTTPYNSPIAVRASAGFHLLRPAVFTR